MGLESASYTEQLNSANPPTTDPKSGGDDHLRLIKLAIKNTFPLTSIGSGILFGNGGAAAVSAATGAQIAAALGSTAVTNATNATNLTGTPQTAAISWSAKQSFPGSVKLEDVLEKITLTGTAPSGTFDCLTQGIQYFTGNATANWVQNFRGDGSNTLDSVMAVGETLTCTIITTQSTTAYYPTTHQIDGVTITPKWLGGSAPAGGDVSSINTYTYTIIKVGSGSFVLFAAKSKLA